ncbi:transposase (plasmid) [Aneurinibacillus sp. Ricciae_BoGa-3]|nr:transposase [Aneurinibacillus sp. Ricciae_BoGa-3]WCK57779.1 transposase [Aneurinibacillus sp. Ricciae_BoGa-3]
MKYAQEDLNAIRVQIKNGLPKDERRFLTKDRWVLLRNKEDLGWKDIERRMAWFRRYPLLEKAYWLKEGIRDVYKLLYRQTGSSGMGRVKFPPNSRNLKRFVRPLNNKAEIFNYFDSPFTNAYTESINNIIKSVEKAGKGYTFDVLRAKVLYGTKATIKKPKYTPEMDFQRFEKLWGGKFDEPIHILTTVVNPSGNDVDNWNCGVDMTTLSEILERGEF